jgi:aarF domain-containing kinase
MQVNIEAFARDLETLFAQLDAFQSNVEISADRAGTVSASINVDESQINRLLLEVVRIGESNGIRFPR